MLYFGDCLDIMLKLPDHSVDALIADWPYKKTRCTWDSLIPLDKLWPECKRVVKPGGAIVLFGKQPFTSLLVMSNPAMFKYALVWKKSRPTGFLDARRKPLGDHEDILIFGEKSITYNPQGLTQVNIKNNRRSKGGECYGAVSTAAYTQKEGNYPRSVLEFASTNEYFHPTQKPLALLEYLVRTYTNPGETVLDNTMGSGTTGVACINTGRQFIGIEKEPKYYAIAQQRIGEDSPQNA